MGDIVEEGEGEDSFSLPVAAIEHAPQSLWWCTGLPDASSSLASSPSALSNTSWRLVRVRSEQPTVPTPTQPWTSRVTVEPAPVPNTLEPASSASATSGTCSPSPQPISPTPSSPVNRTLRSTSSTLKGTLKRGGGSHVYPDAAAIMAGPEAGTWIVPSTVLVPFEEVDAAKLHDLGDLSSLNEASMLYALRERFFGKQIYTNSGSTLISINPFELIPHLYTPQTARKYEMAARQAAAASSSSSDAASELDALPPHVFKLADASYRDMVRERRSQSIVIGGESGAGKTEAAKYTLRYLTSLNSHSTAASGGVGLSGLESRIHDSGPLLEAFGNSRTVRNHNSSRFGKYIRLHFREATPPPASSAAAAARNAQTTKAAESSSAIASAASHGTVGQLSIHHADIQHYLLERSRVVFQAPQERNYHVLYQLLAGVRDKKRREELGLPPLPPDAMKASTPESISSLCSHFSYLSSSTQVYSIPGVDDAKEWDRTVHALEGLDVSVAEQRSVEKVLAAILTLGNVAMETKGNAAANNGGNVAASSSNDAVITSSSASNLARVCSLLSLPSSSDLERVLTSRMNSIRGEVFTVPFTVEQSTAVRDALAKSVYANLFEWIMIKVNRALRGSSSESATNDSSSSSSSLFIGLLDVFGFEHFEHNSLEQVLINFCNEKLQQHYLTKMFKDELHLYESEGIDLAACSPPPSAGLDPSSSASGPIQVDDNEDRLQLIEGRLGVLSLLNEECIFPKGSDASFVAKLLSSWKNNALIRPLGGGGGGGARGSIMAGSNNRGSIFGGASGNRGSTVGGPGSPASSAQHCFIISHYAADVTYDAAGFLSKNKDALSAEVAEVLSKSTHVIIRGMIVAGTSDSSSSSSPKNASSRPAAMKPSGSVSARASFIRAASAPVHSSGPVGGGASSSASAKSSFISQKFKEQLNDLMAIIGTTQTVFVRCIKPCSELAPNIFTTPMVSRQLHHAGILDAIRIRSSGFATRLSFEEVAWRYRLLLPMEYWPEGMKGRLMDDRERAEVLMHHIGAPSHAFALGASKLFLRDAASKLLDAKMAVIRSQSARVLQMWWRRCRIRRRIARKAEEKRLRLLYIARITAVQAQARVWLARRFYHRERTERTSRATLVQSLVRRHLARKHYIPMRDAHREKIRRQKEEEERRRREEAERKKREEQERIRREEEERRRKQEEEERLRKEAEDRKRKAEEERLKRKQEEAERRRLVAEAEAAERRKQEEALEAERKRQESEAFAIAEAERHRLEEQAVLEAEARRVLEEAEEEEERLRWAALQRSRRLKAEARARLLAEAAEQEREEEEMENGGGASATHKEASGDDGHTAPVLTRPASSPVGTTFGSRDVSNSVSDEKDGSQTRRNPAPFPRARNLAISTALAPPTESSHNPLSPRSPVRSPVRSPLRSPLVQAIPGGRVRANRRTSMFEGIVDPAAVRANQHRAHRAASVGRVPDSESGEKTGGATSPSSKVPAPSLHGAASSAFVPPRSLLLPSPDGSRMLGQALSLASVLAVPTYRSVLRTFLARQCADESLEMVEAVEAWEADVNKYNEAVQARMDARTAINDAMQAGLPPPPPPSLPPLRPSFSALVNSALEIFERFIDEGAPRQVNIDSNTRREVRIAIQEIRARVQRQRRVRERRRSLCVGEGMEGSHGSGELANGLLNRVGPSEEEEEETVFDPSAPLPPFLDNIFKPCALVLYRMMSRDVFVRFQSSKAYDMMVLDEMQQIIQKTGEMAKGEGWIHDGVSAFVKVQVLEARHLPVSDSNSASHSSLHCRVHMDAKTLHIASAASVNVVLSTTSSIDGTEEQTKMKEATWADEGNANCAYLPLLSTTQYVEVVLIERAGGSIISKCSNERILGRAIAPIQMVTQPPHPVWFDLLPVATNSASTEKDKDKDKHRHHRLGQIRLKLSFLPSRDVPSNCLIGVPEDSSDARHVKSLQPVYPFDASWIPQPGFQQDGYDLDLTYIADRLIAMRFPYEHVDSHHSQIGGVRLRAHCMRAIQSMLEVRHQNAYMIVDLTAYRNGDGEGDDGGNNGTAPGSGSKDKDATKDSDRDRDKDVRPYAVSHFQSRVKRLPIRRHRPPTMRQILEYVKAVHTWLTTHPQNVVITHAKNDHGRVGLMMSAYLLYCGHARSAAAALQHFTEARWGHHATSTMSSSAATSPSSATTNTDSVQSGSGSDMPSPSSPLSPPPAPTSPARFISCVTLPSHVRYLVYAEQLFAIRCMRAKQRGIPLNNNEQPGGGVGMSMLAGTQKQRMSASAIDVQSYPDLDLELDPESSTNSNNDDAVSADQPLLPLYLTRLVLTNVGGPLREKKALKPGSGAGGCFFTVHSSAVLLDAQVAQLNDELTSTTHHDSISASDTSYNDSDKSLSLGAPTSPSHSTICARREQLISSDSKSMPAPERIRIKTSSKEAPGSGSGSHGNGTSAAATAEDSVSWEYNFDTEIPTRGDVRISFYRRPGLLHLSSKPELLFAFAFHTSFLLPVKQLGSSPETPHSPSSSSPHNLDPRASHFHLKLSKPQLDKACEDSECKNFPPSFRVEAWFTRLDKKQIDMEKERSRELERERVPSRTESGSKGSLEVDRDDSVDLGSNGVSVSVQHKEPKAARPSTWSQLMAAIRHRGKSAPPAPTPAANAQPKQPKQSVAQRWLQQTGGAASNKSGEKEKEKKDRAAGQHHSKHSSGGAKSNPAFAAFRKMEEASNANANVKPVTSAARKPSPAPSTSSSSSTSRDASPSKALATNLSGLSAPGSSRPPSISLPAVNEGEDQSRSVDADGEGPQLVHLTKGRVRRPSRHSKSKSAAATAGPSSVIARFTPSISTSLSMDMTSNGSVSISSASTIITPSNAILSNAQSAPGTAESKSDQSASPRNKNSSIPSARRVLFAEPVDKDDDAHAETSKDVSGASGHAASRRASRSRHVSFSPTNAASTAAASRAHESNSGRSAIMRVSSPVRSSMIGVGGVAALAANLKGLGRPLVQSGSGGATAETDSDDSESGDNNNGTNDTVAAALVHLSRAKPAGSRHKRTNSGMGEKAVIEPLKSPSVDVNAAPVTTPSTSSPASMPNTVKRGSLFVLKPVTPTSVTPATKTPVGTVNTNSPKMSAVAAALKAFGGSGSGSGSGNGAVSSPAASFSGSGRVSRSPFMLKPAHLFEPPGARGSVISPPSRPRSTVPSTSSTSSATPSAANTPTHAAASTPTNASSSTTPSASPAAPAPAISSTQVDQAPAASNPSEPSAIPSVAPAASSSSSSPSPSASSTTTAQSSVSSSEADFSFMGAEGTRSRSNAAIIKNCRPPPLPTAALSPSSSAATTSSSSSAAAAATSPVSSSASKTTDANNSAAATATSSGVATTTDSTVSASVNSTHASTTSSATSSSSTPTSTAPAHRRGPSGKISALAANLKGIGFGMPMGPGSNSSVGMSKSKMESKEQQPTDLPHIPTVKPAPAAQFVHARRARGNNNRGMRMAPTAELAAAVAAVAPAPMKMNGMSDKKPPASTTASATATDVSSSSSSSSPPALTHHHRPTRANKRPPSKLAFSSSFSSTAANAMTTTNSGSSKK